MEENSLPVILVSAGDIKTAENLITEIVDDKAVDGLVPSSMPKYSVWHIQNKYYRADVRLIPIGDSEQLPLELSALVEAHIIYIIDAEIDAVTCAEKRLYKAGKADVCLLLFEGSKISSELNAWASSHHYEPIALRETQENASDSDSEIDTNEPFQHSYGIVRAKAALHAHTWSGLERLDLPAQVAVNFDDFSLSLSSDEEWEEWAGAEDGQESAEREVERAEAFAAALTLLRGAGERARGGRGEGDGAGEGAGAEEGPAERAARRLRAERALAAFCRALGTPLHLL